MWEILKSNVSIITPAGGNNVCGVNLINDGIVIDSENNQATIEWQGVERVEEFICRVNGVDEICK